MVVLMNEWMNEAVLAVTKLFYWCNDYQNQKLLWLIFTLLPDFNLSGSGY